MASANYASQSYTTLTDIITVHQAEQHDDLPPIQLLDLFKVELLELVRVLSICKLTCSGDTLVAL